MWSTRQLWGRAAVVSAFALVLAGCTSHPATSASSSSPSALPSASTSPASAASSAVPVPTPSAAAASVGKDGSAELVSQGFAVQLGKGVASGGRLLLTPARSADVPGIDSAVLVKPLGPAMDVELDGGSLKGTVTVTFPVPPGMPDSTPLVVVWQDGQGGWQWLPVTRTGDYVAARTARLSWGFLAVVDATGFAAQELSAFSGYVSGRAGAKRPVCQGTAQIQGDGTKVVAGKGSLIKWCYGLENGQRVVKITNNAQTFQQVTYPDSWAVVAGESNALSFDALARALGGRAPLPFGTSAGILGSGGTITLSVPPGSGGMAGVTTTRVSLAVSAIAFGAKEYAAVLTSAESPYAEAAKSLLADPTAALGITSGSPSPALKPCGRALRGVKPAFDATSAHDILYAAFECVPVVMTNQLTSTQASPSSGGLPVLATAASQALTAIDLLANGDSKTWDRIAPTYAGPAVSNDVFIIPGSLLSQSLSLSKGWAGITPGQDLQQAAAGLGLMTGAACGGGVGPAMIMTPPLTLPYVLADSYGGLGGNAIDVIEVDYPGIAGPDNLQVGQPVSKSSALTSSSRVVEKHASVGSYDTWILRADHGWYFWVNADPVSRSVVSFGLASTLRVAQSRSGYQGGC